MPDIDRLEEENERKNLEVSIAEKRAMIARLKAQYGSDWKRFVPFASGGKGSGIDWEALRFQAF